MAPAGTATDVVKTNPREISMSKLKTASDFSSRMDSLRSSRSRKERDWKLNLAFYRGQQYSFWNPGSKRVENLPVEDGEKPRYRVRIVSNQIAVGVQSLKSKIIRTKPVWGATPSQPGDGAVKAAQFVEDMLGWWWRRLALSNKYAEAVEWSLLADAGYWRLSWDPYASKEMRFLMDPEGNPVTDHALSEEYRNQMSQMGLDSSEMETIVYLGDVKVEVMSPFDVFLDPTAKSIDDAKWVITAHHLEPDEIKMRFNADVKADKSSISADEYLSAVGSSSTIDPTVKTVYCGYFKKSPVLPNGRYVIFIEDPDKILVDEPWPWPINELPIVQFEGISVPGTHSGDCVVTHARPLQKQLNRLLSQVTEYTNMVIKPRVWAPVNSLRTRLTTEPGAVYEYTPVGNFKPEIETLPSIPPYVFEFIKDIGGRIRDAFGLTEVTEGTLPPNLEAADAIDLLQEMATDRFVPSILSNERSLAKAGQFLLALAQRYYEEPRLLTVQGLGGVASVKEFTKTDFGSEITVHVEAGSSMPRTRAARRKQVEKFMDIGLISPQRAWKHYDIADVKDLAVQFARDEDHALREHDKLISGNPLNPEAVQQVMGALQQGINPQTGEPLKSEEEAQQVYMMASLATGIADDDTVHEEKHRGFIVSQDFEHHSPEVRKRFLMHYELTVQKIGGKTKSPEPAAPRVTLQLKGAVTPTAESAILSASGVSVDPKTLFTEPPMETLVTDSVDQPDVDRGGAGMEGDNLSEVAQMMLARDLANAQAQQQYAQGEEQNTRDSEMHHSQSRKARADADFAERRAVESDFRKGSSKDRPKGS